MTEEVYLLPPQNIEAERAVLSACLMSSDAIDQAKELCPDDFYKQHHGKLFEAMANLSAANEPIDLITLDGKADRGLLLELASEFVTAANIDYHVPLIKEAAKKRQLIKACSKTIEGMNENSLDDSLALLRNLTSDIVSGRSGNLVSYKDLMRETSAFIEDRYNNRNKFSGVQSGFTDLDDITDGWQKADLIILGARPGMGKSAWSQVCCENSGLPCGIVQLEMGNIQTGIRAVSRDSDVSLFKLRKGFLGKEDWPGLTSTIARLSEMEIYIDFSSRKVADIEKTFTKMVELHNVQFVVIDYLQLADASGKKNKNRTEEVAETSMMLKHMAKQHNIPVMALAQLNREIEKRKGKPTLSDLRDSGQIEQDADMVIFLYEEDGYAVLDIAKGRNVGLGQVRLLFNKDKMQFMNMIKKGDFLS